MQNERRKRMQQRKTFNSNSEWLAGRKEQGIGASSAAAVVGLSPWKTPTELWKELTGQIKPKDLSDNQAVQQGNRMEPAIRHFFQCRHPEYELEYHQYDLIFQSERPWMFATLDGEFHTENGRNGILEIKNVTPRGKTGWEEWNGKVPTHYYIQILHQFLATGYDMAILCPALYTAHEDVIIREYEFYREEQEEDMKWLLEREEAFWRSVKNGTIPAFSVHF